MSACDTQYGGTALHLLPAYLPDRSSPTSHYFHSSQFLSHAPITSSLPVWSIPTLAFISSMMIFTSLHGNYSKTIEIVLPLLRFLSCWGIALQDGDLLPPRVERGSDYPLRYRFLFQQALRSIFRQNEANSTLMIFTFIHS